MPIIGGILVSALALTACGPDNTAAPTAPVSTTGSPVTSTTTASSPTKTTSSPATRPPAQSHVLGPNGYGKIKLGMSFAQVKAAGVLQENEGSEPYCNQYKLFSDGKRDGFVYITKERGVEIIAPDQKVSTPEGMTIGSTFAAVRAAYPKFDEAGAREMGRTHIGVPGNAGVVYRIGAKNNAVSEIALQLADQTCYE